MGAQQRDAEPPEQQPPPPDGGPEEDQSKGVEMEQDFDGTMHDVDMDGQQDRDSDEEDGDDNRIEQQMGEVCVGVFANLLSVCLYCPAWMMLVGTHICGMSSSRCNCSCTELNANLHGFCTS